MKNTSLTQKILEENPKARDDSSLLVIIQWARELKVTGKDPITLGQIYKGLKSGELTQADSITRASRKLQEENIDLQGEHWQERQQKAFKFKEDIKTNNWRR